MVQLSAEQAGSLFVGLGRDWTCVNFLSADARCARRACLPENQAASEARDYTEVVSFAFAGDRSEFPDTDLIPWQVALEAVV